MQKWCKASGYVPDYPNQARKCWMSGLIFKYFANFMGTVSTNLPEKDAHLKFAKIKCGLTLRAIKNMNWQSKV